MEEQKVITPYGKKDEKKKEVAEMFDNIAHSYDFLNHFFSLGIDKRWRKKAIRILQKENPKTILDVATGTGDFAIEAIRMGMNPEKIVGVDISEGMLEIGRKKMKKKGYDHIVDMQSGDSENLPFENETFDAYTVAFGVRNFENLEAGLTDMYRVLKTGGTGVVLEFSKPRRFPMKQLYFFYFQYIMPTVGKLVSKDNRAYTYLPESVKAFPDGEAFTGILKKIGYKNVESKTLTGGIATIYTGKK